MYKIFSLLFFLISFSTLAAQETDPFSDIHFNREIIAENKVMHVTNYTLGEEKDTIVFNEMWFDTTGRLAQQQSYTGSLSGLEVYIYDTINDQQVNVRWYYSYESDTLLHILIDSIFYNIEGKKSVVKSYRRFYNPVIGDMETEFSGSTIFNYDTIPNTLVIYVDDYDDEELKQLNNRQIFRYKYDNKDRLITAEELFENYETFGKKSYRYNSKNKLPVSILEEVNTGDYETIYVYNKQGKLLKAVSRDGNSFREYNYKGSLLYSTIHHMQGEPVFMEFFRYSLYK